MTQWAEALADKADNLSSVPGTQLTLWEEGT